jgi:FtsZ-binding cell division protein ZapB
MMGKATTPYDEFRDRRLLEEYKKAYPNLRVLGVDRDDVQDLRKRVEDLEKENAELNFIQKDFQETLMALAEIMVPVAEISHDKIREGDPDFETELEKGLDAMADKDSVKRGDGSHR